MRFSGKPRPGDLDISRTTISLCICCLFTTILAFTPALAEDTDGMTLNQQGLAEMKAGRLAEAERLLSRALNQAQKKGLPAEQLAIVLNNVGLLRLNQKKYPDAESSFLDALSIFSKSGQESQDMAATLENLGVTLWRRGEPGKAEPWFKRALAIDERLEKLDSESYAESLVQVGDYYFEQGNFESAEALYRKAVQVAQIGSDRKTSILPIALDRMAGFYQAQGNLAEAKTYNDRALSLTAGLPSDDKFREAIASHHDELLKAKALPNLVVLRPQAGETFYDSPILIKLQVDNFELVKPDLVFGKSTSQTRGHIHVSLDSYPLVATADTQMMVGKTINNRPVPEGLHNLVVDLVTQTHEPLTPPVRRYITFYTLYSDNPNKSPE